VKYFAIYVSMVVLFFTGCSAPIAPPVEVSVSDHHIDYDKDVKPILDARCVVCHSCYNSPCQLKLSSYEGIDRGATKALVYDGTRLFAAKPTRLFMDAQNTTQWRGKGFYSVTQSDAPEGYNNSILLTLLEHKKNHPDSLNQYRPESDTLTCARNQQELANYLAKHSDRGMPYGFPPLKKSELKTIAQWLDQGAQSLTPSKKIATYLPSKEALPLIEKWEAFFNADDAKHQMSARYLYEHLYLAHLYFTDKNDTFYELVRSTTPSGEDINIIATLRPYDDPQISRVYYRFRRIHATIVHKTHMVFELNDKVLERFNTLFITPTWDEVPHLMAYDSVTAANPFITFAQIPARSRYQFLLDHSEYVIRTFIRGPVCKGQIALNVINDQFWVLFLDPDADMTINTKGFLASHYEDLRMPIEKGSSSWLFSAIQNSYTEKSAIFHTAKQDLYMSTQAKYSDLWVGEEKEDAPILTVFRHFDSASVHRGALGDLPRTAWVIDYPLFERIYYALVAGFDVYGNVSHQLEVRLYMDGLRREGEDNALRFMPEDKRMEIAKSIYIGAKLGKYTKHVFASPSGVVYKTDTPKREFLEHFIEKVLPKDRNISFDKNYFKAGEALPELPSVYKSVDDYVQGFRAISVKGTNFIETVHDFNSNLAHMRIRVKDGDDVFMSIIVNRWHDNVAFLFSEAEQLDPSKDTADFFVGLMGSYPNYYYDVAEEDLPDFFNLIRYYVDNDENNRRLDKYSVDRNSPKFWETYDIFQKAFYKQDPISAGLFDLNRYYYQGYAHPEKE